MTPTIVVAGTSSSVGKTTISVGLMHTLHRAGLRVQPFKVGPDFLDGMQHEKACGVPSINLDGWMMQKQGCLAAFHRACMASSADIAIVEGCMGLHDGRDGRSDEGSTAQIAKWLGAPVLLVLDAWNLARSAAAMAHGFVTFDEAVRVCGVVFNRVAGAAHGTWLREAIASAPTATAALTVLGCVPSERRLAIKERLLGLLPPSAAPSSVHDDARVGKSGERLVALERLITEHIDLAAVKTLAATATTPPPTTTTPLPPPPPSVMSSSLPPVRIAVARDAAFCFVYLDNLRLLEQAGATLLYFSPCKDRALPVDADALYLIGGYPELHSPELHANADMRAAVRTFCASARLVWAECGGLMYLAQQLVRRPSDVCTAADFAQEAVEQAPAAVDAKDRTGGEYGGENGNVSGDVDAGELAHRMCGVLPFDVTMTPRMVMGYCTASLLPSTARILQLPIGTRLRCQQYHFSEATVDGDPAVLVDQRTGGGAGIRGVQDHAFDVCMQAPGALAAPEGVVVHGNTIASYCHLHLASDARLAGAFVRAARRSSHKVVSMVSSGTEMVALLLGSEEASRRLIGVSEYCDWPADVVTGVHVVSRAAVDLSGLSGEQVEEALQQAKRDGLSSAHVLDVPWLMKARPGLVLTQDTCPICDAAEGSVHAALESAGLGRERALTLNPKTVDEMLTSMRSLGPCFDRRTRRLPTLYCLSISFFLRL